MKPSQLFEGKNSRLYKTFMKTKKNTIKGVKAWALIDNKNKIIDIPEQLTWGDVDTIAIKRLKKDLIEYEKENEEFKVIPVLITPINK